MNKILSNYDLKPVTYQARKWGKWDIMGIWGTMSISIPTYMLGSSLVSSGISWYTSLFLIVIGCFIILIPILLISHPGVKYGIPFPVLLRSSFGIRGSIIATLARGLVGVGWFSIQSWIASTAIYYIILKIYPAISLSKYNIPVIGLNFYKFICFLCMLLLVSFFLHKGLRLIKNIAKFIAPLMLITSIIIMVIIGSKYNFLTILNSSEHLKAINYHRIPLGIIVAGITAVIGYWSTLSINMCDFSRYIKTQKDQIIGQSVAMPLSMILFSFVGIFMTSYSILEYKHPIWDPIIFAYNHLTVFYLLILLAMTSASTIFATISADMVASSNTFASLEPQKISFERGGYITLILAVIMCPWKLIEDPSGYIYNWLIAYSSLLGSIGGVMICDYYFIRRTKLIISDLYSYTGAYRYQKGWNVKAFIAVFVGVIVNMPGFLLQVKLISNKIFMYRFINELYDYSWFIAFAVAFTVYASINKRERG